jgi:hypothetical protein
VRPARGSRSRTARYRPARRSRTARARRLRLGELGLADAVVAHEGFVEHQRAVLTDGTQDQPGPGPDAELAGHDHVQRCAERSGDRRGDGYPSGRETEDDDVVPGEVAQPSSKARAGVPAVGGRHLGPPAPSVVVALRHDVLGHGTPVAETTDPTWAGRSAVGARRSLDGVAALG